MNEAINSSRPWKSIAAACAPSQVSEMNERLRREGVTSAYYRKDGIAVAEDRRGRNAILKVNGLGDRDAGYGDRTPD